MRRAKKGAKVMAILCAVFLFACLSACQSPNQNTVLTADEVHARAFSATATVEVRSGLSTAQGTAFFLSEDGMLATNFHVVKDLFSSGDASVVVRCYDGREYRAVAPVSYDEKTDLALLSVQAEGVPFLKLKRNGFCDGDRVYVLGSPGGAADTFSEGRLLRSFIKKDGVRCLETDIVIRQGNSGGPLLSESGAVIGIVTFATSSEDRGERYFAVSVRELAKLDGFDVPLYWNGSPALNS